MKWGRERVREKEREQLKTQSRFSLQTSPFFQKKIFSPCLPPALGVAGRRTGPCPWRPP